MGKIMSTYARKAVRNWNIENRAHRYIDKHEKPVPAPRHPSTSAVFEQFAAEHPEIREEISSKNEQLAGHLKGMVVDPEKLGEIRSKYRKLPEDRSQPEQIEYGYVKPTLIPPGRFSLRQAMDFISLHVDDPSGAGNAESIAKQYNIDIAHVENILLHFGVFTTELPTEFTDSANVEENQSETQHESQFETQTEKQV